MNSGIMDIVYRRATNHDRPVVHRLIDAALREYGLHLLLDTSDVDLNDIEAEYDARGGRFELIEDADGTMLGVLAWRPGGAGVVELKKLYLAPAARGRGLGRRALARVVDAARADGAHAIVLETAEVLAEANRLYAQSGFVRVQGAAAATFATLSDQCDLAYRLDLTS
ncbi:MAG: GNAT family N-acetyltransferase [Gemmatirosa sp.]|nr:GNAT family N-acetyltransferase [Gemmatirosa sp.]